MKKAQQVQVSTTRNQFIETSTKPLIILEFANRDFYIFNTKDKKRKDELIFSIYSITKKEVKYMSKLSNVLMMLQLLQNGRKYSIRELSEKLEVSPRMIRQYKEELEYAGIYIETIRGPYGGYVLNQSIKLPSKFVKPESILLNNKDYYNILNKCIKHKYKCFIEYYSKEHDKMTQRIIRPYNLIALDGEWGVAAYCENKNEIRHFYLSRIKEIKVLEESF